MSAAYVESTKFKSNFEFRIWIPSALCQVPVLHNLQYYSCIYHLLKSAMHILKVQCYDEFQKALKTLNGTKNS